MKKYPLKIAIMAYLFSSGFAFAGQADVLAVKFDCTAARLCSFSVTVQHADSGWLHYADNWQVVDMDGNILATRRLAHPHVAEQPFTRSLSGVEIPAEVEEVRIRAHDSVHKNGGIEMVVNFADSTTEIYEPPKP